MLLIKTFQNNKKGLLQLAIAMFFQMTMLSNHVYASTCPTRIMPLGDSITVGYGTSPNSGYRKSLWNQLSNGGYSVNFVGSQNSGNTSFDADHEGYGGSHISFIADNIYNWATTQSPEVILLHIGTNAVIEKADEVARLLDQIDQYETDSGNTIQVILAQIINRTSYNTTTTQYNESLYQLTQDRIAAGDQLTLIDMENILNTTTDYFDDLHPNTSGYTKMAQAWFTALEQMLTLCSAPSAAADDFGPLFNPIPETQTRHAFFTPNVQVTIGAYDIDEVTDGFWQLDGNTENTLFSNLTGNNQTYTFILPQTDFNALSAGKHILSFRFVDGAGFSRTRTWQFTKLIFPSKINVGGNDYVDSQGYTWLADNSYSSGIKGSTTTIVSGTSDPIIYQSNRWDDSPTPELSYRYLLSDGTYRVRIHLAETWIGAFTVGARVFDINLENTIAFDNVDIFAEAGSNAALIKEADIDVFDGELLIEFTHEVQNPSVRAIEIIRLGNIVPDLTAPTIPANLAVTNTGIDQISLSWTASTDTGGSGLAGYRVYRDGIEVGTTVTTSYTDIGLNASTLYSYTVAADDNVGNTSLESSTINVLTNAPDVTKPTVPTNLMSTVSGTNISLSWTTSSDTGGSGMAGYRVYRDGLEIGITTTTNYLDSGLTTSTLYTYTIAAFDNANNLSDQSIATNVTTADLIILVNVGGGDYIDSVGQTWLADFGFNIGFPGNTTTIVAGTSDPVLYQTNRWDDSLPPELAYTFTVPNGTYRVRIHLAETWSGAFATGARVFDINIENTLAFDNLDIFSEAGPNVALIKEADIDVFDGELFIEFTHEVQNPSIRAIEIIRLGDAIPDFTPPSIPVNLITTTASSNQISIGWTTSTDMGGSGLVGYRVYRDGVELGTTTSNSYTDIGLNASTTYVYTVAAEDNAGNISLESIALSASTNAPDLTEPSTPANLIATTSGTSISLNWTDSNDTGGSGLSGYRIYRDGLEIGVSTASSYLDSGLAISTLYSYTVAAFDNAGNLSAQSQVTSTTTSDTIILINVGGSDYIDSLGQTWLADFGFNTGFPGSTTTVVADASEPTLYQSNRWDDGTSPELSYSLTVTNGNYRVRIHLAETWSGAFATGARVFDIHMENNLVFDNVDIFAEADSNTALIKEANVDVLDGELFIEFTHEVQNPSIRAIEIIRLGDAVPDFTAPNTPVNLATTSTSASQISLSWIASIDTGGSGLAGYRIYRDGTEVGTTVLNYFTDTSLNASTFYSYAVAAYDNVGNISLQTLPITASTDAPDNIAPDIPTSLINTVSGTSISLSWAVSTDTGGSGLAGYRIFRDGVEVGTSPTESYIDSGLSTSTLYSYTVAAYDNAGNISAQSLATNGTTADIVILVNVGGNDYIDNLGRTWLADFGFNAGYAGATSAVISGTNEPTLYQSNRWDDSPLPELSYSFAVPNGNYRVRIHLAETWSNAFTNGARVFDISAEGTLIFNNVDIFAEAGANTALVKEATVSILDGELFIEFGHEVQNPSIRALEIIKLN